MSIAAIVIGRNEGIRLHHCLASLKDFSPVIYVDSGSTDGSVSHARETGAEVVQLDMSRPFTAARARNAGLARLDEIAPECPFVQVLDGDCEVQRGWIIAGLAAVEDDPSIAVVCGRRRERYPEASLWNRLIDMEWDTPIGEAKACGGDALLRRAAISEVGGYPDDMIAGEEPEMCFRLRQSGWRILRIDAEMALHDAAMTSFSQWWRRGRRSGYAFAEGAARHWGAKEGYSVVETLRAIVWGIAIPALTLLGALLSPWALLGLAVYPAQILRLYTRNERKQGDPFFLTLSKFPEAQGVAEYWWRRLRRQPRGLIEYK